MTFIEKIVQELLNNSPKTDEAKICEALHIPRYLREYDFCDFTKETNKRLIQTGLIGHYKITDNQKVEISVNEVGYCIRIVCKAIRRGANAETVKELGRWSSVETLFRHYAHVLRDDLKKAVETL